MQKNVLFLVWACSAVAGQEQLSPELRELLNPVSETARRKVVTDEPLDVIVQYKEGPSAKAAGRGAWRVRQGF